MDSAFAKPQQPEVEPMKEPERAYAVDFETVYTNNSKSQIKSEAVRSFLTVPSGDIVVKQEPRVLRTICSTVPVSFIVRILFFISYLFFKGGCC